MPARVRASFFVARADRRLGRRSGAGADLAVDTEYSDGGGDLADGRVVDAGPGLMLHPFDNQSISARYSTRLGGKNHVIKNGIDIKYAYACEARAIKIFADRKETET